MGYNNKFLVRESTSDSGQHTSGSLYSSPDIICHTQVENPQQFFMDNYDTDPNQKVDPGSNYNLMYARVKNLADSGIVNTGYLHLYQCGSSLFMNPGRWRDFPVKTMTGESYMKFAASVKNTIVVGNDIFRVNKLSGQFCLVAIVSEEEAGTIPESFTSYDTFNYWVRSNPGVALRNLSIEYNYEQKTYERSDSIEGSGDKPVLGGFKLTGVGLPAGTRIRMRCDAIGMNKEDVYDPKVPLTDAKMVNPTLKAYVISSAITPTGVWPEGASLCIEYLTESHAGDLCYQFGETMEKHGFHRHELMQDILGRNAGKLVLTGRCETMFLK